MTSKAKANQSIDILSWVIDKLCETKGRLGNIEDYFKNIPGLTYYIDLSTYDVWILKAGEYVLLGNLADDDSASK